MADKGPNERSAAGGDCQDDEYPEILLDVLDRFPEFLIEAGIDRQTAEAAARLACEFLRLEWGGQKIYLPMGASYTIKRRNRDIKARWNGQNTHEMCRQYDISEARVRQIAGKRQPGPKRATAARRRRISAASGR